MRNTIIIALLLLSSSALYAQKSKKVEKKINKYEKESYTIVKPKGESPYKDGEYRRYSKYRTYEKGQYKKGLKVGKWETNENNVLAQEFFTPNGNLDSLYYKDKNETYGVKYNEKGKEISRFYYTSSRSKKTKKIAGGTLHITLQNNGYTLADTVEKGLLVNGKREGEWYGKNDDGCYYYANYKKDTKIGEHKSYYRDGTERCVINYNEKGERNGILLAKYNSGDTLLYKEYQNGKANGLIVAKHQGGSAFITAKLLEGKLIQYTEYDTDGKEVTKSSVKDGEGTVYSYAYEKGRLTASGSSTYKNGMLNGKQFSFDADTVYSIKEYKNGKFQRYIKKPANIKPPKTNEIEYYSPLVMFLDTMQQTKAKFPGGDDALQRAIFENITYPEQAIENDIQGTVYVTFVVNQEGNLKKIGSLGTKKGFGLEEEAIRIVESTSGKWIPATLYGLPVNMRFRLPIKYQLF